MRTSFRTQRTGIDGVSQMRSVETVVDDVPGTDASLDQTYGIGTSAILQFGLALVDERNESLKIGLKL